MMGIRDWIKHAVGETEQTVTDALKEHGYTVRVTQRDGRPFIGTRDYRTDRVNLVIEKGKVTRASIG